MKLRSFSPIWSLTILTAVFTFCLSESRTLAADEGDELKKIEEQFQAIQKVVADPLADERVYFAARSRLQRLRYSTEKMIEKHATQDEEDHPLHKLQGQILTELKVVNSRLPGPPIRPTRGGLPVPKFDPDNKLGQLSAELHKAQTALVESLRYKSKNKDHLIQVILAQENLAWEAGWPFTRQEVNRFQKAKGLTPEIYLTRRERGIERINNQLARDATEVGRKPPRPFVIHHPEDKADHAAIQAHLAKARGKSAAVWRKGTRSFDAKERAVLIGTQ